MKGELKTTPAIAADPVEGMAIRLEAKLDQLSGDIGRLTSIASECFATLLRVPILEKRVADLETRVAELDRRTRDTEPCEPDHPVDAE